MLSAVFPWIRVEENDVIELFGVGGDGSVGH